MRWRSEWDVWSMDCCFFADGCVDSWLIATYLPSSHRELGWKYLSSDSQCRSRLEIAIAIGILAVFCSGPMRERCQPQILLRETLRRRECNVPRPIARHGGSKHCICFPRYIRSDAAALMSELAIRVGVDADRSGGRRTGRERVPRGRDM